MDTIQRKYFLLFIILAFTSVNVSCQGLNDANVLLTEQTLPASAIEDQELLAYGIDNSETLEQKWNEFEFSASIPDVNWSTSSLIIIGMMEPGCEIIVTEVQIQETELLFKTELDTGLFSDDCSMEANPVSFVIEMEKETVHNAEKVQFHGKEADILNGTDPSS